MGTPLFDRATPGVTLTAAGQQFRTGADELIRRIIQLRRESREAGGKEGGDPALRRHPRPVLHLLPAVDARP